MSILLNLITISFPAASREINGISSSGSVSVTCGSPESMVESDQSMCKSIF